MKIALIAEVFNTRGGGAERNLVELATGLSRRGHEVTILAGAADRRAKLDGVRIEISPRKSVRTGLAAWAFHHWVARSLDSREFDASLSTTTIAPATVVQPLGGTIRETRERNVALRAGAFSRAWKRVTQAGSLKSNALLLLERRVIADTRVKAFAALSNYVVRQLADGYGVESQRIELIPNAVEIEVPSPDQRAAWRRAVRTGLDIRDSSCVFAFAAFNPRLKGIETLLRAVAGLKARGADAVVMIAGSMRYRDQASAASLGIREMVRFLGPTQEMPAVLSAADATVLPTFYDPSSRAVIESLIMGTPAISTSFNGASDFIVRDRAEPCGFVIADPADDAALADAMAKLCDPAVRARCSAATAGLAESLRFSHHLDRIEALLLRHAVK